MSNVCVEYKTRKLSITALNHVSFSIPNSSYTVGIVGESGSGKTTMGMTMMNAIEPPGRIVEGNVEYNGSDILRMNERELRKFRWREVSMVYQSAMNSLNPVKKISDHIVEVLREHSDMSRSDARARAIELLDEVGIRKNRADDYPHEFSGGMRQRAVIALALALSPKIMIADEPTSALDVVVQKQILSLLRNRVREKNLSLIFITHEISLLCDLVENAIVMYRGEIVETGPIAKLLFDPLHPYTEMLLSTLLTLESKKDNMKLQSAREHYTQNGENYCIYINSCKYAFDRCRKEKPVLREIQKGRAASCHRW